MPNQQNPYTSGTEVVIEEVMSLKGFADKETFTAGAGGQSVFTLTKEIGGTVIVFENGTITTKTVNITGLKEVTTDLMPQGTVIDIIY